MTYLNRLTAKGQPTTFFHILAIQCAHYTGLIDNMVATGRVHGCVLLRERICNNDFNARNLIKN